MDYSKHEPKSNKQVVAISTATFRKVKIIATPTGVVFFWSGRQYECRDLSEATATIDAIYARLVNVLSPTGAIK